MQNEFDRLQDEIEQQRTEIEQLRNNLNRQHNRSDFDVFCGRPGDNFELWADRFNRHAQANNWTDDQKRLVMPSLFREAAETVYRAIPAAQKQTLTFLQLIEIMSARFVPAQASELKSAELQNRCQRPGETVTEFAIAIQQLANEAYPELSADSRDQIMRRFFINGLNESLWQCVFNRGAKTFVDAEVAARDAEAQSILRNRNKPRVQTLEHRPQQNYHQQNSMFNISNHRFTRPADRTIDGRPICFFCQRPGHVQQVCKKRLASLQRQYSNQTYRQSSNYQNQRPPATSHNPPQRQFHQQRGVYAMDVNQNSRMEQLSSQLEKERETTKHLENQCAALRRQVDRMVLENVSMTPPARINSVFVDLKSKNQDIFIVKQAENVPCETIMKVVSENVKVFSNVNCSVEPKMVYVQEWYRLPVWKYFLNFKQKLKGHHIKSHIKGLRSPKILSKLVACNLFKPLLLAFLLANLFLFACGDTRTFFRCGSGKGGQLFAVPPEIKCMPPPLKPLKEVGVKLFLPSHELNSVHAWKCRMRKRKVCTYVGIIGSKGLISDTVSESSISHGECEAAVLTKQWRGQNFVSLNDDTLVTNNSLTVEFKYCCAEHCTEVLNFIVEKGQVATLGGHLITSDLGNVGSCLAQSGYCNMPDGVIFWDQGKLKPACRFTESKRPYTARQNGDFYIIDDVQGAFSLRNVSINSITGRHCLPADAFLTHQGPALQIFELSRLESKSSRKTRAAKEPKTRKIADTIGFKILNDEKDPVNSKLEYLEMVIEMFQQSHFREIWMHLCEIAKRQLSLIKVLLQIDPSLGAQVLLQKENLHAQIVGEVISVSECDPVRPDTIFWDYKVGDVCYAYLPIQFNETIQFALPGSLKVVSEAPTVDCNHHIFGVFHDGHGTWRSNRGQIHVSEISSDMLWKGDSIPVIFDKPAIFHNELAGTATSISMLSSYVQKLHIMQNKLSQLINYSASMSLDPQTFQHTIDSIEKSSFSVFRKSQHSLESISHTTSFGLSTLVSKILIGPFQFILNSIFVTAVVFCMFYLLIKLWKPCLLPLWLQACLCIFGCFRKPARQQSARFSPKSETVTLQLPQQQTIYGIDSDSSGILIWVLIENHGALAMIDTGTSISLMHSSFFAMLHDQYNIELKPSNLTATSVSGHQLQLDGYIMVTITIDNESIYSMLYVTNSCPNQLILGRELLKQFGGDLIMIHKPVPKAGHSPKLTHQWHGPYEIVRLAIPDVWVQPANPKDQKDINPILVHVKITKPFSGETHFNPDPNLDQETD